LVRWHVELYVDTQHLGDMLPVLMRLPQVSIDHLGLTQAGFTDLLRLVEHGACVKATRFAVLEFDVGVAMRTIYDVNPNSLMFGTDLPGTRAPRCFHADDLHLLRDTFNHAELDRVMYANAMALYHSDY